MEYCITHNNISLYSQEFYCFSDLYITDCQWGKGGSPCQLIDSQSMTFITLVSKVDAVTIQIQPLLNPLTVRRFGVLYSTTKSNEVWVEICRNYI